VLVVPVGGCGTEVGNPSPSFGDTGEAAATLAAASSPRTVPTVARTVAVMRRNDAHGAPFKLADWLVPLGKTPLAVHRSGGRASVLPLGVQVPAGYLGCGLDPDADTGAPSTES
jgi:hypothetical protein